MKLYSTVILIIFGYVCWLFSASIHQLEIFGEQMNFSKAAIVIESKDFKFSYSNTERQFLRYGLVDIQKLNPDLKVELAYATNENLTGGILYQDLKRGFLQTIAANKLVTAQQNLELIDSTLSIVVLDAARPQSIQFKLWEWAKENGMEKYVASPWSGSNHNFGCAVDVTLVSKDSLLDMGTKYDYFGPEAEPRYQWQLLKEGKLSQTQIDNRLLLKDVMKSAGFSPIQTEWWHFNGLSKERAREYYKLIK